ncbi:recombinase family protein [Bacillus wiedmannii]|uniref:recombinase family protein n=1 Tax=Bacillus wiedmannii TaxID=1890302 RepID=UPI001E459F72|nr:recombinase family protein [Bacillus wiedmannii]MCC2380955.1 recombinase family protein [Bacillus wiedmannii]MCC2425369.1 recombinase family protein [Bacillus wiedmannii]
MNQKTFAYIRVSTKEQNEMRQKQAMLDLGVDERDIFIDKQTGKNFDRPQYKIMKQCLRSGDLLLLHSIDRFGRNSREIRNEWEYITQTIGADIRVLDMPLLDTTQHKDLLGTFVSELVLQVLAFVSQKEIENTKKRQSEGIAIAKKNGVYLGRPKVNLSTMKKKQLLIIEENFDKWKNNEITAAYFMNLLELKRNSFYKIMKEYEMEKED